MGEATLVIGQSRIVGADGSLREVQRGSEVRVGDRIETRPGGHVHVRFVDGGRVSVRPASRLVVEQYAPNDTSGSAGSSGAIKFRLEEGMVRSITGAWGEAARDRFRLNTPVAAIGIKGTDFVVRAHGESTAASVYAGAIVLSPLTDACMRTVGPCGSGVEKLLSADMKGQMLELHRDQLAPRLVPALDLAALASGRSGVSAAPEEARATSAQARVAVGGGEIRLAVASGADSRGTGAVTGSGSGPGSLAAPAYSGAAITGTPAAAGAGSGIVEIRIDVAGARGDRPLASETVRIEISREKPLVSESLAAVTLVAAGNAAANIAAQAAAAAAAAAEALARRNAPEQELFWVRYPWALALAGDDFTRRFDIALALGTRSLALEGAFSLRRPEGAIFAPQDAMASFRLTGAAAAVARDGGFRLESVRITEGSLSVDFARAAFASSLTAVGPVLGSAQVLASGGIDAAGLMRSTSGNAVMVGGFNGDGYKAGLSFTRDVPGGVLQGISLWNR